MSNVKPFPKPVAVRCAGCGAIYARPRYAAGATYCRRCWAWHRALEGLEAAAQGLRSAN